MTARLPRRDRPERLTSDDDLFVRMEHALGLPVVNQAIWRLPAVVDRADFDAMATSLQRGRLSRLVVRTPFPLRDRWIHTPRAGRYAFDDDPITAADCMRWADAQLRYSVDSQSGPAWSLTAVTTSDTGETVVSWISAHAVADGIGVITGISESLRSIEFDTTDRPTGISDTIGEAAATLRTSSRAAWQLLRRNTPSYAPPPPADPHPPAPTRTWSGSNPSAVISIGENEFEAAATAVNGSPSTLFTAIVVGVLEATGRVHQGQEITVSLPVSTRTAGDRRANATTGVGAAVRVDSGRYHDLSAMRAAAKSAYKQVDQPTALALLGRLAQPFGDSVVRRLASDSRAPLCLASNLGVIDAPVPGLGGPDGRLALRSATVGASLETMRRMAGGISGWSSRCGGTFTLCLTALDPDRVPDVDTLVSLFSDELGKWGLTGSYWGAAT